MQGIQAQTLANLRDAKEAGLTIIGVVNKVDLFEDENDSQLNNIVNDVAELLKVPVDAVLKLSAKTGAGVPELLTAVVERVPAPTGRGSESVRALVFDSFYDNHKGIVTGIRVFDGVLSRDIRAQLIATETDFKVKEIGYFGPELVPAQELVSGEIGYIATGIKDPSNIQIGDTVTLSSGAALVKPLPGYQEPNSTVFVSFYPEDSNEYKMLGQNLQRLRLNDSALNIGYDQNDILGRGYKVGFLGQLHYEITADRLRQEFGMDTIHTFPSVVYRVQTSGGEIEIVHPEDLPDDARSIKEPMTSVEILLPARFLNSFLSVTHRFRVQDINVRTSGEHVAVDVRMPLAELISDFDDTLKSITEGYGSFSYELYGYQESDVVPVQVFVSGEPVPGLSRFLPRDTHERESRLMVERLKKLLPRQQYTQPIQAAVRGRIIARETVSAFKKNVTGHLYGGDRTRKMKLWKKQKEGKKKLKELGLARIDASIFKELLKK